MDSLTDLIQRYSESDGILSPANKDVHIGVGLKSVDPGAGNQVLQIGKSNW